ncbi:hypothetical protein EKO04_008092 [Ascochyta lentis]|uniref:Uncharacterized protein n=1 Tax=Ascochyta lentis TaxID=205686 RepID=A0A8H7MCH6_9PLEO|nr:hypothetical protein EKO04_008092 [Ascochyta lentis]
MANSYPSSLVDGDGPGMKHHNPASIETRSTNRTIDVANETLSTPPNVSSVMGLQGNRSSVSKQAPEAEARQAAPQESTDGIEKLDHNTHKTPDPGSHNSSSVDAASKTVQKKGGAHDEGSTPLKENKEVTDGSILEDDHHVAETKEQTKEERELQERRLYCRKMVEAGIWRPQVRPSGGQAT